ncbi:MAG: polysaccharide deacetylase family protein [Candidatus Cloacimonetes bacterium]|nr:polysaccharide deacetylase family protein [Candidatus Cloacimonadota bacterium]
MSDETERIVRILDYHGVKATFFIVADIVDKYPRIVKILKNSPHEIASHSLTHQSSINSNSGEPLKPINQWINDQINAKQIIENCFDREIVGFRAPNGYMSGWMLRPLYDMGFRYDSSLAFNSVYNKTNVILKDNPSSPYFLNSKTLGSQEPDTKLVELPFSSYRFLGKFLLPAGGAFFFRLLGYHYFKMALDQSLRNADSMFYLHALDISTKKIPVTNLRNRPAYWLNKGIRTERGLVKMLKRFGPQMEPCNCVYNRFINEGNA